VNPGPAFTDGAFQRQAENLGAIHQVGMYVAVGSPAGQHKRPFGPGEAIGKGVNLLNRQAGNSGGGLHRIGFQLLLQYRGHRCYRHRQAVVQGKLIAALQRRVDRQG